MYEFPCLSFAMISCVGVFAIQAQQVPLAQPAPLVGTSSVSSMDFLRISSVQGLGSGKLLVLDGVERTVQVFDERLNDKGLLIRKGDGPGEMRSAASLLPDAQGGAMIPDFANFRWLSVTADGRPGKTTLFGAAGAFIVGGTLWGGDTLGCIYSSPSPKNGRRREEYETRIPLHRVCANGTRVDTLAWLRAAANAETATRTVGSNLIRQTTTRPLFARDIVTVSNAGILVVLRADEGVVEVLTPSVRTVQRVALQLPRIMVDANEKRASRQSRVRPGRIEVMGGSGNGRPARSVAPPRGLVDDTDPSGTIWPKQKPYFLERAYIDPFKNLWIRRVTAAGDSASVYDVIDRLGQYTGAYRLPDGATIVGFDATRLFFARADESELVRLYAHLLPSSERKIPGGKSNAPRKPRTR